MWGQTPSAVPRSKSPWVRQQGSMLKTSKSLQLANEVIARCETLASFSEDPHGIWRTYLAPPMRDVHRQIAAWLQPLHVSARIDAAGNLRALYPGTQESGPRLLIGSHLDTVPNAGRYDGILGVMLAIALLDALDGRKLPFAIETVGFSEEEGVRFGTPFIGSRALIGRLDDSLLSLVDAQGISVRQAIRDFGLDPNEIPQAGMLGETLGFLEFHIEQGPVLEQLGLPLASVDAIAGQTRMEFTFMGRANHAGTTPMSLRSDALAGAAEWITTVEREAKATPGLVATVGSVKTLPGATNVIAGEVRATLDVRHRDDQVRTHAVTTLTDQAKQIAQGRGLSISTSTHMNQSAIAMDAFLVDQVEKAIAKSGCRPHRMASGAGHDAMILAEKVPSAMIFVRTAGGISHDPAESVAVEDVEKAIECGLYLLDQLASSPTFLTRTQRA
jgi:allantoate deiminase